MSCRGLVKVGVVMIGVLAIGLLGPLLPAGEDPRIALRFLQELRDRGLHDLALQYIDQLRADPGLPANLKMVLDYQEGRTQIDEAAKTGDLVRRRELLEEARTKLDELRQGATQPPPGARGLGADCRMLVERGHLALLMAEDAPDEAQKTAPGRGPLLLRPGARRLRPRRRAA